MSVRNEEELLSLLGSVVRLMEEGEDTTLEDMSNLAYYTGVLAAINYALKEINEDMVIDPMIPKRKEITDAN